MAAELAPSTAPPAPEPRPAGGVVLGPWIAVGRVVASFLVTLAGVVLLAQLLLHAAPGDPVDLVPNGEEMRAGLEAEWGLDRPFHERYLSFLGRAARGDLGTSLTYRPGASVTDLVLPAAGRSLGILLPALVLAMGTSTVLAWRTAGRPGSTRRVVQVVSVAPVFLLAFVAVHVLNEGAFLLVERGLVPRPSWFALPDQESALKLALAIGVLAVGSSCLAEVHAAVEDELVRIRNAPFVDATLARGAAVGPVVLRNLVAPLATLTASRTAFLAGGLVIVEKVLHLNGAGAMLWQACRLRDYPLALGIAVLAAAVVAGARLAGDLVRVAVDPRLREPSP